MCPTLLPARLNLQLTFLVLLICCARLAAAQQMNFNTFSIEDGLSAYAVTDIFQDQQGLLWIGTVDGLNRYDGYDFKVFKHQPGDESSLPNNYISGNAIAEDAAGYLWIGTWGGLSKYDPYLDTFTNYRHNGPDTSGLSHNRVMGLHIDGSGRIWSATLDGVDVLDEATGTFTHYRDALLQITEARRAYVTSITEDKNGMMWVGTTRGLFSIDPLSGVVTAWPGLENENVWRLYCAPDGQIWAGGVRGQVYQINGETLGITRHNLFVGREVPESAGYVTDFMTDHKGILWVGTYDGGLFHFDGRAWGQVTRTQANPESLPGNRVTALYQDRTGKMWVGTWSGLAHRLQRKAFAQLPLGLPAPLNAKAVLTDRDGGIWVGTANHGLVKYDATGVTRYNMADAKRRLNSNNISALMEDHEGNVWVGTSGGGISIIAPATGTIRHIVASPGDSTGILSNQIYSLMEDRGNKIWIGTVQNGLVLHDPETGAFTHFLHDAADSESISANEIWTLFEDRKGQRWAGTQGGGLNRIDVDDTGNGEVRVTFKKYTTDATREDAISSNNVVSFFEDSDGIMWLGTMGGGLNRFDPATETFTSWQTADGLPHNNVACILPDGAGNLWIPTTFRLSRFNPETGQVNLYTVADGIKSAVFYLDGCAIDAAGNLYMANSQAVTVFKPEEIRHNTQKPDALITDVRLFNASFAMDSSALYKQKLTLRHDENFLGFRLGTNDFTIPEKNQYRYKLDGIDAQWVEDEGIRLASYPALPPGTYTFRAEASNNDGVWSTARNLVIEILPPYWQRWWFRFGVFSIVAGLLAAFLRFRYLQHKRLTDTRQQIADDLHDDIAADLSAMTFFLNSIRTAQLLTDEDRSLAENFLASVRRNMQDLRDVVWLTDPSDDSLGELVERMEKTGRQFTRQQTFTFTALELPVAHKLKLDQRRQLFYIYKEALHNAVRHAEATNIAVTLTHTIGKLCVTVTDNGAGFDLSSVEGGNGLDSMQRRAEQGAISLRIASEKEKGTTIHIEAEMT